MSYTDYKGNDVLDSEELADLLTEMANDRVALVDAVDEADTPEEKMEAAKELADWDYDNAEQFRELEEFCNEAEQYCEDWHHGAQLIEDGHWAEYAEQLADDMGAIPRQMPTWVVIDWEQTAENLKADYTPIEWGGYTYWVR